MDVSEGFSPIARQDAEILILGSLPGDRSIAAQEYYAHPRNAFWRIMEELFAVDGNYDNRCRQLQDNGIALWDVLEASVRPGSLDANIDLKSARSNDFDAFLDNHRQIRLIAFNGRKAEQLFTRLVKVSAFPEVRTCGLPSSSPAYAAMSFSVKLGVWRSQLLTSKGSS